MKPVNILILVLAGALGGAVVMKVTERHRPATVAEAPAPLQPETQPVSAAVAASASAPAAEPAVAVPSTAPPASATPPAAPAISEQASAPPPLPKKITAPPHKSAVKRLSPRAIYADVRPSPFSKPSPPLVEVTQAEPSAPVAGTPAPVQQPAPPPQLQTPPDSPIRPARTEPEQVTPPPAAPEPVPHTAKLTAGMLIPVRLLDGLSSERNAPGDAFLATLDRELVADGFVIAERGARVEGRVVSVDRGDKMHGGATLVIQLTRLHTSDNQDVAIQTDTFQKRSEPNHTTDAEKIGGGAAIGAIIGAIAGGGKGAAIGAGAGAGAGTGDVLLTRKPARLPSETRITFRLSNDVRLTEKLRG